MKRALPATALPLHIGIEEAEGLIQPLLDKVNHGPVNQLDAARVDEHFDATILEHQVAGVHFVSVIDDVRES